MTLSADDSASNDDSVVPDADQRVSGMDKMLDDFRHYYDDLCGQAEAPGHLPCAYRSLVQATRDRITEQWNASSRVVRQTDARRVGYISLEFLVGRLLRNALLNLDLDATAEHAMEQVGVQFEEICELERDAGLGNGGLGRLAACFLDSCATLGLPVVGYGLRYRYGMFQQRIEAGYQIEAPDSWLSDGFPWETKRSDQALVVQFGGTTETYVDDSDESRHRWIAQEKVLAVPYDVPVPGYRNGVVNTLRLWSATTSDEFDLHRFNAGDHAGAVANRVAAENITMVLYPNADSQAGMALRLRQQYFLASASLQDTLRDWATRHGADFSRFAEKNCFQLNDTHPAVSIAELMRLLMDDHGLAWRDAWRITRKTMAYTNHTLLPEALEVWPAGLFASLLPRLFEIIHEIDARFVAVVRERWPGDDKRVRRMAVISKGRDPMVRMAHLAIVGSFSVNGVAELHSLLLIKGMFRDFYELWPDRFNNKTNGVTQRRWLAACNPALGHLITTKIGDGWVTELDLLKGLREFADDATFRDAWLRVKLANKQRLAALIEARCDLVVDPAMMFDVQVKRIHEYKRQLLNLLHVIHLYDRILRDGADDLQPRAVIIGGKAAPGYAMAKSIIKCIGNVAKVINDDPRTAGKLRLIFFPDYNVSVMEVICPAADLSEQISTAGKEASGTGNMKLMMNGALTIGTLDGANIEIRQAVGAENFFLFGLTVEQIEKVRSGYDPGAIIAADDDFSRVMALLEDGHFNADEAGIFDAIIHAIRDPHDQWMTAADFRGFVDAQRRVEVAYGNTDEWVRMSILNTAASGRFSTDRTMREYNRDIWHLQPLDPAST